MLKALAIILLILIIFLGILAIPVLFQEENPIPVLVGIPKLVFSDEDIISIQDNPQKYLSKAENATDNLSEILEEEGYVFKEQFGSTYLYKKGNEDLFVSSVMYTRWFKIFTVQE